MKKSGNNRMCGKNVSKEKKNNGRLEKGECKGRLSKTILKDEGAQVLKRSDKHEQNQFEEGVISL